LQHPRLTSFSKTAIIDVGHAPGLDKKVKVKDEEVEMATA